MRAEGPVLWRKPKRAKAPIEFLVHSLELLEALRQPDPDDAGWTRLRKNTTTIQLNVERFEPQWRLECFQKDRNSLVGNRSDEADREMHLIGRDPPQADASIQAGVEDGDGLLG